MRKLQIRPTLKGVGKLIPATLPVAYSNLALERIEAPRPFNPHRARSSQEAPGKYLIFLVLMRRRAHNNVSVPVGLDPIG
jgi:hypothetical protein